MNDDHSKRRNRKNRKTKKFLVFNEQDRLEYLTGFHKRKKERQKKAKEEKEKQMHEDKKELKRQRKELMRKSQNFTGKRKHALPDIDDLDNVKSEVFDLPTHTVTVTDISEMDLAGQNGLRLGQNKAQVEDGGDEDDNSEAISKEKLKQSLKKLKKRQGEIDSSMHPAKKTKFSKSNHKRYDKKSLKKRKENFSYKKHKKRVKPRN